MSRNPYDDIRFDISEWGRDAGGNKISYPNPNVAPTVWTVTTNNTHTTSSRSIDSIVAESERNSELGYMLYEMIMSSSGDAYIDLSFFPRQAVSILIEKLKIDIPVGKFLGLNLEQIRALVAAQGL